MHTFIKNSEGKYEIGHYHRELCYDLGNHDVWVRMFKVDRFETAIEAVRYLNGGDRGQFMPICDAREI